VTHPHFSPTFILLQQEGHLFSATLAAGLTELRRANVHEKGAFYNAFFQLSIGLERTLKTCIIIDHMLSNALEPPSKATLKGFGHNLLRLYSEAASVSERRDCEALLDLEEQPLTQEIIQFLDDFARSARYFNLDSMAAGSMSLDPLEQWHAIMRRLLAADATEKQVRRVLAQAGPIASAIEDSVSVIMTGLDKQPLTAATALAEPGLNELASRYAVFRLLTVLEPLKHLLSGLSMAARPLSSTPVVPEMHEFLQWVWLERSVVLKKKRWP